MEMRSEIILGERVLINYNDAAGRVLYLIEYDNNVGNWIDSFDHGYYKMTVICS